MDTFLVHVHELELDGFPRENRALHLHDHVLLFLANVIQSELHAMDLLPELLNLLLPVIRVQPLLHLFFLVDLPLTEQNLLLGLDDFRKQLRILVLDPVDFDIILAISASLLRGTLISSPCL